MSDKNGGPAFPTEGVVCRDGILYEGMTLRDYFAAKAMQGMIARTNWGVEDDPSEISNEAYGYADAMIKSREK